MSVERSFAVRRQFSPIYGLVLASGLSRRFGSQNKLLAPLHGRTVITRTLDAYLDFFGECWVVLGHDSSMISQQLDPRVHVVLNTAFTEGQSAALKAGLAEIPPDVGAILVGPADQPLMTGHVLEKLVVAWRSTDALSVVPLYSDVRGNPVAISRDLFPELRGVRR